MRLENKMSLFRMKLEILTFFVFISFLGVLEGQFLHIKHAPPYIAFSEGSKTLASSDLPLELASALGVKSPKPAGTMRSKTVLKRPAANVLLTLITSKGHTFDLDSMAKFPIEWDVPFVDVAQLMNTVQRKFLSEEPLMLNLLSDDQLFDIDTRSPVFKSLPSSLKFAKEQLLDSDSVAYRHRMDHLNASHAADSHLMAELQTVQGAVSALKSNPDSVKTKTPDLLSFTLSGLKAVGDAHGVTSEHVKEAEKLVTKTVEKLTDDLKKLYGGNVMVEVVVTPATEHASVRHTRSLMAADDDKEKKSNFSHLNLALDWYEDFPVTFNIVLWLMVILVLLVTFIAYGVWNMNPNLESILYRVPQDEIKKNN